MEFLTSCKRLFLLLGLFLALAFGAGVFGALAYTFVLPRLSTWPLVSRLSWPSVGANNTTVIQRTEQVVLSQEEGLERFIAAPRTAVVSIISVPTDRVARLSGGTVNEWSGVLVTNDGMVATYMNETPQVNARRFTVSFSDSNASIAEFVAYDPVVNVAYFRTERADTPAMSFANSNDIRQGRRFIALAGTGDPEESRLASGYIGERNRTFNLSGKTVASTDDWEGVFLPDRLIGTGWDGGAAVAMNGDLIGLIGTTTLDAEERAFILPANALRQSLQRVISDRSAARPNVGAYYVSLSRETALALGVGRDRGAMIFTPSERTGLAVISGSSAEKAGLRYGDIVTAVNGREINLERPLSVALYDIPVGERVTLSIERAGSMLEISLNQ
jgi:S1-C subfamily serine protease